MITPIFEITQDDQFLFINIKAPNSRICDTEIEFADHDLRFFSKPYFLRLSLPCKVTENGKESATYDSDKGVFVLQVPKQTVGEYFEGLDMLTKLLAPIGQKKSPRPLIEVISNENAQEDNENEDDEEYDWHIEQHVRSEEDDASLLGEKYGFANQYSAIVARMSEELMDVIDIKDPEHKNMIDRRKERLESESNQFSDDHYLSDLYDGKEIISSMLAFEAPWDKIILNSTQQQQQQQQQHDGISFNDEEKFKLKNFPNKEYLNDKKTNQSLLIGLVDILFAYAYDMRTTEGEHTVESAWTICKLSSTLSWFETFTSLNDVLISCFRRSLCFPLCRHWQLSLKVIQDTVKILQLGRAFVLKCLLDIHSMFNSLGDSHYLLNDLYITDYCIWIQSVKGCVFQSLALAVSNDMTLISKKDVNLELDILESAACLAIEEQQKECSKSNSARKVPCLTIENKLANDVSQLSLSNRDHETEVEGNETNVSTLQDHESLVSYTSEEDEGLYHETTSESSATSDTSSYTTSNDDFAQEESKSGKDSPSSSDGQNCIDSSEDEETSSTDSESLSTNVNNTSANKDIELQRN